MKYDMEYGQRITEEFQRAKLAELLPKLLPSCREVFNHMYPDGVRKDQLVWALTQVNNTIISQPAV